MGSRLTGIVVCGLAALVLATSAEADVTLPPETLQAAAPNWASPQIAAVVAAGVMGPDVATFRPDDSLTRGELHDASRAARPLNEAHWADMNTASPTIAP